MAFKITGAFWLCLLGTMMVFGVQQASCMNHECSPEDCVPLHQCQAVVKLIRNPTETNVRAAQSATCFIERSVPMVCCHNKRTTQPTKNRLIPYSPGTCGQGTSGGLLRIYGGGEAPLGGYPWIAALGYREVGFRKVRYLCAGSIINERYILTAAHCVAPSILSVKKLDIISVGDWDLSTYEDCQRSASEAGICSPAPQNYTYEEIIIHPKYNMREAHSDDIALIRVSTPMDLSGKWVHPICLPPQGLNAGRVVGGRQAVVAGWGTTESGQGSNRLRHVLLPLEEIDFCNRTYSGKMVEGQICFGGHVGEDSCSGDSGGPLVIGGPGDQPPFLLVGIVSYGPSSCGLDSVPGVYTSVSHYRDWIDENVRA